MNLFQTYCNNDKQPFIGLTETWLKDHFNAELIIENYRIFRADRIRTENNQNRGRDSGGVAIYSS